MSDRRLAIVGLALLGVVLLVGVTAVRWRHGFDSDDQRLVDDAVVTGLAVLIITEMARLGRGGD